MFFEIAAVAGGLVLLVGAADRLVLSAVRVSRALGVSAVLIGAVVVGLGTSLPELLVSGISALNDELPVAVANVVGSNIANVSLVLGTAALLTPVVARLAVIRREGYLMLASLAALTLVLLDEEVARWEGGALAFGLLVALYLLVRWSWADAAAQASVTRELEEYTERDGRSTPVEMLIGLAALAVTVFGADLLLEGALALGRRADLSDTFLGLALGVGTSLPELATAVAAARRREADLVLGNVLGSNIFNSLAVAGTAGMVGPAVIGDGFTVGIVAMLAAALVAGGFSITGSRIARLEGAVLIAGFAGFTVLWF